MKLIKKGKTKDVYALEDGNYLFKMKDDTTTDENGNFDPGRNKVGMTIDGLGKQSLALTSYYFKKLNDAGIYTHYVDSDLDNVTMTVRPADMIGNGLEVICRLKAAGSFLRRYGAYAAQGQDLHYLIEFTLKDDDREDPPASRETLVELGLMTDAEYDQCKNLAREITKILDADLTSKGLTLYDIKYEFGRVDGRVALVDEISGGIMRVFKDGNPVAPMDINGYVIV